MQRQSADMPAPMDAHLIDLDRAPDHSARKPGGRPRRWRRAAIVVGLLLVGALLGGAAGSVVTLVQVLDRQNEIRNSTVSVLVLATTNPADGGIAGLAADDGTVVGVPRPAPRRSITTDTQVTIVNTGPVAINVPSLSGTRPGVVLAITEKPRWISPGTAVTADAVMTVECATALPLLDVTADLRVENGDDTRRVSVTFWAGTWEPRIAAACGRA